MFKLCLLLSAAVLARVARSQGERSPASVCNGFALGSGYQGYLDTSFLGPAQSLVVGSVNYSYKQFGPLTPGSTGRPLVLIAGQGATKTIWTNDLLKNLAQGRQVTVFDNRGIGLSTDSQTGNYTISDYAESTVDFVTKLFAGKQGPPDILGWSEGAFIGLTIAADYPSSVNRLVVADTTAGAPATLKYPGGQAGLALITPELNSGSSFPPAIIYPDQPAGNAGLCRFQAFRAANTGDEPTPAQSLTMSAAILEYTQDNGVYSQLANITTPTLIIAGQQDRIFPVANDLDLAAKLPDASLIVYPDAGHAAILQHALTNAAFISAWLDQDAVEAGGVLSA